MPPIEVPYSPRNQMLAYHDRRQRFAVIVAHRRFGKTTAALNDLQRGALSLQRTNPRFAYISPLLKQSKEVAWDILKQISRPLREYGATANESELRIDYPNGGRIRLYGGDNPDAMRGIGLDGVVLDEYAQMDPTLWREVIRPALSDREGWATFIGTPKGRDAFWKLWRDALKDPQEWFSLMLRASETGVLSDAELVKVRRQQDDDGAYAREYECSFDVPDDLQFISGLAVQMARARQPIFHMGPRLIGVDIARQGSDSNVILFRDGDSVPSDGIVRFKQPDLMQTVGRVTEVVNFRKPDAVFIDGGGVGGGVVDRLRQLGYRVVEVNSSSSASDPARYKNIKAEMWAKMREWLKDRGSIPADEPLVDDLSAPKYKYDVSNRLQIESKEELRARGLPSTDSADALALTFAHPVASRDMLAVRWSYAEDVADPFGD
jgi:hypothetical protein